METIHAIFENGIFRPVVPVELPERAEYAFEPRLVAQQDDAEGSSAPQTGRRNVYAILSERYASGHADTAARHNEHQP
jgi:predicted DNA-binding antitoxin AbrB/MazE fold protein